MSKRCFHALLQSHQSPYQFYIVIKLMLEWHLGCRAYPTFQKRIWPSDPPEVKRPSWTGCQVTALASFLWPRNVWRSSLRLRKSNNFSRWSRDAVMSQFPLSFHFRSMTVDLWAWRVARAWPHFGSQILIGCWLSLLPDTISDFVGCQSTHFTSAPCPLITRSSWHRRKSKILKVPSSLQLTNFESVGQKLLRISWEKRIIFMSIILQRVADDGLKWGLFFILLLQRLK